MLPISWKVAARRTYVHWAKKKFVGENPNILALPMTFKKAAVHLCMKNPDHNCMDAYGNIAGCGCGG